MTTETAAPPGRTIERPVPDSEHRRMRALHRYRVLDTSPEQSFDDLVALASHICATPIALVSLVDTDRQWFKARVGLDAQQTPRQESICQYTIMDDQVFEVHDATDDPRFDELPIVLDDPRLRFYAGAPLIEPGGERIGSLCVIDSEPRHLDAKQRESLEALAREVIARLELRQHVRFLEKANDRLRDFAHVAAHDMRAPLRAIASLAGFAEEDLGKVPEKEVRSQLALLRGRAVRMENLIDSLLTYARASEGSGVGICEPGEIIDSVIGNIEVPENYQVKVQTGAPPLQFDPLRFEQLMQNLIGNAIKYNDKPAGHLDIGFRLEPNCCVFHVRDNGPGIDPKFHERIFERFETLQPKDEIEGTGIGLSIVKRAVEEEGGDVWVESEPGQGACFFVRAFRSA